MDNPNSRALASRINSTKAILQYGAELKVDIQNQVYGLIAALKKREHDLCREVDLRCLEQLCEAEEWGLYYETEAKDSFHLAEGDPKENCYFTTSLEFDGDFKSCKRLLQNYGQLKKFNCSNKIACQPHIDKSQLPESQSDVEKYIHIDGFVKSFEEGSSKECDGSAESFEVFDPMEWLQAEKMKGYNQIVSSTPEKVQVNLSKNNKDDDEIFEKTSICSVDSFDVLPTVYCGMDNCTHAEKTRLMTPSFLNPVHDTSCSSKVCPKFNLPNLHKKEPKDGDWLARNVRHLTKEKSPVNELVSTEKEDESKVLPSTSEAQVSKHSIGQKDEYNPANTIQECFRAYLQKDDIKTWIHPKQESIKSHYEQWVAKETSPCIFKSAGMCDVAISAFSRQLNSFVI